jgi:hypothetical protein
MLKLSNTAGSFGYGETQGYNRNPSTADKKLIAQANTVPIRSIIKLYGIKPIGDYIICPFSHHKGGRENTASFRIFDSNGGHTTNSFNCFGCKSGGGPVQFVRIMDSSHNELAAKKIINHFRNDVDFDIKFIDLKSFTEQMEIMVDVSNIIREFRKTYLDERSQIFIEKRCKAYDDFNLKAINDDQPLNNNDIRCIASFFKNEINEYVQLISLGNNI